MDDFAMADPVAPDAGISGLGAEVLPEMPPAEMVSMIETPAPEVRTMVEMPSAEASTMIDPRVCTVCGRQFDAMQRFAKCESRALSCSACCPHPFCNEHSPFRGTDA